MKYITIILALSKMIEPLLTEYNAAIAEGKSSDANTVKIEKILQDVETAIQTVIASI